MKLYIYVYEISIYLFIYLSIYLSLYLSLSIYLSCLALSYLILSYLILSYLILSYLSIYLVSSYLILSYPILSYLFLSYLIFSYLILSYLSIYLSDYLSILALSFCRGTPRWTALDTVRPTSCRCRDHDDDRTFSKPTLKQSSVHSRVLCTTGRYGGPTSYITLD